jgi:hypothetical protein
MRPLKRILIFVVFAVLGLCAIIGTIFLNRTYPYPVADRYHLHAPLSTQELSQCLLRDRKRDDLVDGLTVDQIRDRFRGIPIGGPPTDYQQPYNEPNLLWIADTQWCIVLKDGKGCRISIRKG